MHIGVVPIVTSRHSRNVHHVLVNLCKNIQFIFYAKDLKTVTGAKVKMKMHVPTDTKYVYWEVRNVFTLFLFCFCFIWVWFFFFWFFEFFLPPPPTIQMFVSYFVFVFALSSSLISKPLCCFFHVPFLNQL